ncbi:dihydroneopterin aldolase family protein [Methanoregula sp.]|uniref:dihydroneopterin aldolase family protein n=1 Tax=Methanoregula sp. TaxID=2052170 RepID=UPI002BF4E73A|nr:dihydroneopterin aldolase family protein [Methanoregula sp.]HVP97387.1 dihydroneopterin aldolase family protein [Methanoregula sp.]
MEGAQVHGGPADRERAIFEAGIKLGALYHQWVGTPIAQESAASVESAIEKAVILQPFVEEITVRLDRSLMQRNVFGYSELSGLMFDVEIVTRVGFSYCRAALAPQNGYPLMKILECHEIAAFSDH